MLALKSLKPTADSQKKNSADTEIKLGKITEILQRLALLSIKLDFFITFFLHLIPPS